MYLVKHKKNDIYYKNKISNNFYHFVLSEKEAHNFKSKYDANKMIKTFNHPENFEVVKI